MFSSEGYISVHSYFNTVRHFLRTNHDASNNTSPNHDTSSSFFVSQVWQHPLLADPHYLSFLKPKYLWPVIHLVVSNQGHYTFLYGHTKHNQEGGRKEQTNKYELRLAPSARRGKSMWHFCAALRWFTGYLGRIFCAKPKPLAMLTSVDFVLLFLLTALSSRLVSSAFLSQIALSAFSRTFLPWSRKRSRPHALCVGFAPRQTKRFSDRRQHKQKWMLPIVSHKCWWRPRPFTIRLLL